MERISIPTSIESPLLKNRKNKRTHNPNKAVIAIQHNNLVEAKYSMTLQQKRIMIWLISQIKPDDIDFKEHVLSVKELIEICQLSGESAYKQVKDITFSLIEKGIRIINISASDKKKEIQVTWLNSAVYEQGKVLLQFSPKLKPYLLQLKDRFTAVNALDLMQFKSIHAIRIYELLKQYQDIGERILTMDEIKNCCGVKDKLNRYSDFEKKLLLISQREINKKSDIHFEFERIKKGRKIVAIKFILSKNKAYEFRNNPKKQTQETKRKVPLYDALKEFGLSTRITNQMIKEYSEQTIQDAIKAVDLQLSKDTVRNPKAMLLTAIKEKWHPDKYISR